MRHYKFKAIHHRPFAPSDDRTLTHRQVTVTTDNMDDAWKRCFARLSELIDNKEVCGLISVTFDYHVKVDE